MLKRGRGMLHTCNWLCEISIIPCAADCFFLNSLNIYKLHAQTPNYPLDSKPLLSLLCSNDIFSQIQISSCGEREKSVKIRTIIFRIRVHRWALVRRIPLRIRPEQGWVDKFLHAWTMEITYHSGDDDNNDAGGGNDVVEIMMIRKMMTTTFFIYNG